MPKSPFDKYVYGLVKSGGKRINAYLCPESYAALEKITKGNFKNQSKAIRAALIHYATQSQEKPR